MTQIDEVVNKTVDTASDFASAAEILVRSAFRFVRQLRKEDSCDEREGTLRLLRRKELLCRWQAAHLRGPPELPLRWISPVKSRRQLPMALHSYLVQPNVKNEPLYIGKAEEGAQRLVQLEKSDPNIAEVHATLGAGGNSTGRDQS